MKINLNEKLFFSVCSHAEKYLFYTIKANKIEKITFLLKDFKARAIELNKRDIKR
jgi:hypothetical protein